MMIKKKEFYNSLLNKQINNKHYINALLNNLDIFNTWSSYYTDTGNIATTSVQFPLFDFLDNYIQRLDNENCIEFKTNIYSIIRQKLKEKIILKDIKLDDLQNIKTAIRNKYSSNTNLKQYVDFISNELDDEITNQMQELFNNNIQEEQYNNLPPNNTEPIKEPIQIILNTSYLKDKTFKEYITNELHLNEKFANDKIRIPVEIYHPNTGKLIFSGIYEKQDNNEENVFVGTYYSNELIPESKENKYRKYKTINGTFSENFIDQFGKLTKEDDKKRLNKCNQNNHLKNDELNQINKINEINNKEEQISFTPTTVVWQKYNKVEKEFLSEQQQHTQEEKNLYNEFTQHCKKLNNNHALFLCGSNNQYLCKQVEGGGFRNYICIDTATKPMKIYKIKTHRDFLMFGYTYNDFNKEREKIARKIDKEKQKNVENSR